MKINNINNARNLLLSGALVLALTGCSSEGGVLTKPLTTTDPATDVVDKSEAGQNEPDSVVNQSGMWISVESLA